MRGLPSLMLIAFLCAGCNRDPGPVTGAKKADPQEAVRKEAYKKATLHLLQACSDAVSLAKNLSNKTDEAREIVRSSHEPKIAKAKSDYEFTLTSSIYQLTGAGVREALEIKNAYGNARIAALEDEKSVLESFRSLMEISDADSQNTRVASAGGGGLAPNCDVAQRLLGAADHALDRSSELPALKGWVRDERAVLNAAGARMNRALVVVNAGPNGVSSGSHQKQTVAP